jgi:hypothetical protein
MQFSALQPSLQMRIFFFKTLHPDFGGQIPLAMISINSRQEEFPTEQIVHFPRSSNASLLTCCPSGIFKRASSTGLKVYSPLSQASNFSFRLMAMSKTSSSRLARVIQKSIGNKKSPRRRLRDYSAFGASATGSAGTGAGAGAAG